MSNKHNLPPRTPRVRPPHLLHSLEQLPAARENVQLPGHQASLRHERLVPKGEDPRAGARLRQEVQRPVDHFLPSRRRPPAVAVAVDHLRHPGPGLRRRRLRRQGGRRGSAAPAEVPQPAASDVVVLGLHPVVVPARVLRRRRERGLGGLGARRRRRRRRLLGRLGEGAALFRGGGGPVAHEGGVPGGRGVGAGAGDCGRRGRGDDGGGRRRRPGVARGGCAGAAAAGVLPCSHGVAAQAVDENDAVYGSVCWFVRQAKLGCSHVL